MFKTTIEEMAKVYLEELFCGIPMIPVEIESDMECCTLGQFVLDAGEEYDLNKDELISAPEYRYRYKTLWDGLGGMELGREYSYMDPLNHPKVYIQINKKIIKDIRKTTAVLLHELIHYYYWYIGREYQDDSREFIDKCIEMDVPTNYTDYVWDGHQWKDIFDYTKVEKYIQLYISHVMA